MKKYTFSWLAAVMVAMSFLLTACNTPNIEVLTTDSDVKIQDFKKIDKDGLLVLQFVFNNTSSKNKAGVYRVNWYYASGEKIDNEEAWKPFVLTGKQRLDMKAIAPTLRARDYRVEVNFPK